MLNHKIDVDEILNLPPQGSYLDVVYTQLAIGICKNVVEYREKTYTVKMLLSSYR